jgi:hypothetical protein
VDSSVQNSEPVRSLLVSRREVVSTDPMVRIFQIVVPHTLVRGGLSSLLEPIGLNRTPVLTRLGKRLMWRMDLAPNVGQCGVDVYTPAMLTVPIRTTSPSGQPVDVEAMLWNVQNIVSRELAAYESWWRWLLGAIRRV